MKTFLIFITFAFIFSFTPKENPNQWIRINWLGYTPNGIKVAVWCAKDKSEISSFHLVDSASGKIVLTGKAGKSFGAYGPFNNTYRLNFSSFKKAGTYYLKAGNAISPSFKINKDVYKGTADFCLFYLRQQQSGFNPFLKDSCHTHDGYTMYGPMPDSTHIDVVGGWHDASIISNTLLLRPMLPGIYWRPIGIFQKFLRITNKPTAWMEKMEFLMYLMRRDGDSTGC